MRRNTLWIKFIVIGSELAILILAGIFLGNKLDLYFDTLPIFTIIGVIVGSIVTVIVFYSLTYKEHQRMHDLLEKHGIEKHEH